MMSWKNGKPNIDPNFFLVRENKENLKLEK